MNYQILQNATNALKPKGKLIFTTLNALFPLFHSVKDFLDSNTKEGNAKSVNVAFDLMTFREQNTIHAEDDLGNKKELHCNERYYSPSEITWLLKTLNFKTIDIFGAKLGAFSRNDELSTEDFEMLVIAEKWLRDANQALPIGHKAASGWAFCSVKNEWDAWGSLTLDVKRMQV